MVAKQGMTHFAMKMGYLLAKIHMVAKPPNVLPTKAILLSSSKNPYGSKTGDSYGDGYTPLSSSKNPYGSKTFVMKYSHLYKLSSSKNPYGSKTLYNQMEFLSQLSSSKNPYGSKTYSLYYMYYI